MPTYNHICNSEECQHEFEDFYSITKDPPTTCPKCNKETVVRVISDNSSRGIVELTGQEYKDKVMADASKLKKDAQKSERVYSNLLGETKYEALTKQLDKNKKK